MLRVYMAHCLETYERLKGERTLKLLYSHDGSQDSYRISINTGATIEIFCKEIVYLISYKNWWVRDRRVVMYHVYCNVGNDVPTELREKLSEDLVLTQLLHPLSHRTSHKRSIIEAYVDLMISKYLEEKTQG